MRVCVCVRTRACTLSLSVASNSLQSRELSPHQGPQSMELPRQRYWNGLPFPTPEDLPDSGIKPASPELQADSLLLSHLRRHLVLILIVQMTNKETSVHLFPTSQNCVISQLSTPLGLGSA